MKRIATITLAIFLFGSLQTSFAQASDKTKRNFGIKERSIELHACSDAAKAIERKALSFKGIKNAAWNPHTHRLTIQYDVFHVALADSLQEQLPLVWPGCGHHIAAGDSGKAAVCVCR